jgi:hypothetical protein
MALLVPLAQRMLDLRDGTLLVVTKVKLITTSDTLTVPLPHSTTASASAGRVLPAGSSATTVTQTNQTVTITGTVGDIVYVTTLHQSGNSRPEA